MCKNIAFFFSGRGTLINAVLNGIKSSNIISELSLVITNNGNFNEKKLNGYDVYTVDHLRYSSKKEFEQDIISLLEKFEIDLIVLGGFRRIFSPSFVNRYSHMTINTHPSILPAFPGDKAQKKAIDYGVKLTGATIHFINDEVDNGPIIDQAYVRITDGMSEDELKEKIIKVEEKIIEKAVSDFLNENLKISGRKVINKREIINE